MSAFSRAVASRSEGENMKGHDKRLDSYIQQVRPRFERMLAEMVEQPSISMDPTHAPDIRRAALLAVQFLKDLGAEARIVETGGYPVVSGGWTTGSRHPTVTVYNHLDVQPAQEPEWRQPPFAFRKRKGVYYGRGATDDKGPALTALDRKSTRLNSSHQITSYAGFG